MSHNRKDGRWAIKVNHLSYTDMKLIVKTRNYALFPDSRPNYLRHCVQNIARGLLQYKRYPTNDLHWFLQDRNTRYRRDSRNLGRTDVIKLLEVADDNPHFDRFMELPLEVRCMVYEYSKSTMSAIADSESCFKTPTLPALSQVSHLVRFESLEVFYRTKHFPLFILFPSWERARNYPALLPILAPHSHVFLRCTETRDIRSSRHFQLFVGAFDRTTHSPHPNMVVLISTKSKSVVAFSNIIIRDNEMSAGFEESGLTFSQYNRANGNERLSGRRSELRRYMDTLALKAGSLTGRQICDFCEGIQTELMGENYRLFRSFPLRLLIQLIQ